MRLTFRCSTYVVNPLRPRNSLKSPNNSREWLPGRRRIAAVWLRRRPGSGSRPELFWPWPAKGAERPLETSPGLRLDPWGLAEPPTAAARASEPVIVLSTIGGRADTDKRSSAACPRWVGGMLASLVPCPIIALSRTCSFHCWRRRRGQRWPEHSLNVAISTQVSATGPLHVTTAPTRRPRFHRLDVYGDRHTTTS